MLGKYLLLALCMVGVLWAQEEKEASLPTPIVSPNPYPDNVQNQAKYTWQIEQPGAEAIQVFVEYLDMEDGCDFLELSSSVAGQKGQKLSGARQKFWSSWLVGSKVTLRLQSDGSGSGKGFQVMRYRYRQAVAGEESASTGKLWVVLVGNGQYQDKGFNELPCAPLDAKEVYDFLVSEQGDGLPAEQVSLLQNASSGAMKKAYMEWLPKRAGKNDRVMFYYTGHGQPYDNKTYLVSQDTIKTEVYDRGIELGQLQQRLWNIQAKQVLLLLDACYSGKVMLVDRPRDVDLQGEIDEEASDAKLESFQTAPKDRLVISSCDANEQAITVRGQINHSAFNFFLMMALYGAADVNHDNKVEIREVFAYVKPRVGKLAKKYERTQTPRMSEGKLSEPFYVKMPASAKAMQIVIESPEELKDNLQMESEADSVQLIGLIRYGKGVKNLCARQLTSQESVENVSLQRQGSDYGFEVSLGLNDGINVVQLEAEEQGSGKIVSHEVRINRSVSPLERLEVTPPTIRCKPGDKVKLSAVGIAANGSRREVLLLWRAKYGRVSRAEYAAPQGKSEDEIRVIVLPDKKISATVRVVIEREEPRCQVSGCTAQKISNSNYCNQHKCSLCNAQAVQNGLCSAHYEQKKQEEAARRCQVSGCDNYKASGSSFCVEHKCQKCNSRAAENGLCSQHQPPKPSGPQGFAYLREATYSCGGQSHTVKEYRHNQTGMEFVLIPGGTFEMGDNEWDWAKPVRRVTIQPFLMSKYETTQAVWQKVMSSDPSSFKGANRPVENVSWNDCQSFCQKTGLSLPSEAQWEYACRAGTTDKWHFGDSESQLGEYAWYGSNSGSQTHDVGGKNPNAFGLYDMSGNVWEWCQDWYHGSYNNAPSDGRAWESPTGSYRVDRGGGWCDDDSSYLRSAFRGNNSPVNTYNDLGFRVVSPIR